MKRTEFVEYTKQPPSIALRLGVDIDTKTMTMGKNAPDSSRRDNKSYITSLPGMPKQERLR